MFSGQFGVWCCEFKKEKLFGWCIKVFWFVNTLLAKQKRENNEDEVLTSEMYLFHFYQGVGKKVVVGKVKTLSEKYDIKRNHTRDGKSWFNHDLINPFVID